MTAQDSRTRETECDLLVVGSGAGGLSAAATAATDARGQPRTLRSLAMIKSSATRLLPPSGMIKSAQRFEGSTN